MKTLFATFVIVTGFFVLIGVILVVLSLLGDARFRREEKRYYRQLEKDKRG